MKKILVLLLIFIIGLGFYFTNSAQANQALDHFFFKSACEKPLAVKIGSIDPNYNLTQNQVKDDINQSIQIWNKAYGQELFIYDPNAQIPINFLYDQRQTLIDQGRTTLNQASNLKKNLDQQAAELSKERGSLDPQYQQLQKDSDAFTQRLNEFNKQVEYWNSRGGAPPEEYQKLINQQKQLRIDADNLNARYQKYGDQVKKYNTEVNQYTQKYQQLGDASKELSNISQNLTEAIEEKPEEGFYTLDENGQKIDILFIVNKGELIHTLAHELGHALGLPHNNNKKSIMYPYSYKETQNILTPSETDMQDLKELCQKHNLLELAGYRLGSVLYFYQTQLNLK